MIKSDNKNFQENQQDKKKKAEIYFEEMEKKIRKMLKNPENENGKVMTNEGDK